MTSVVTRTNRTRRRPTAFILVAIALVAVAVCLALFKKTSRPTNTQPQHPGEIAVKPPQKQTYRKPAETPPPPATIAVTNVVRPADEYALEPKTNLVIEVGKLVRSHSGALGVAGSTNGVDKTQPMFSTSTEQFFQSYLMSSKRPMMLMANVASEVASDCANALSRDIVVYDDDPEDIVKLKENVAALKEDMYNALREGYSAADVLNAMAQYNNSNVMARVRLLRHYNDLVLSNRTEEADVVLREANEFLTQCNLPPLDNTEAGTEEE